ncbi:MAG: NOL1/NOP2/sun family putative RNA methylase [Euryarchaeota archaeon]|nr:NOL1/NOP2/sun family putative RNA methylase [Euryarchaeota archaeon]
MNGEEARRVLREINRKFVERYERIDGSDEFFIYTARRLRQSIRINTLKAEFEVALENLRRRFELEPVPWCREGFWVSGGRVSTTLEHALGVVFIQEAASMLPVVALEVEPGMKVLDVAAAPGGKSTQIAQYMGNRGCLVANEPRTKRLSVLAANLQRCGVLIARVTQMDGRRFAEFPERFDRVLLDAPCSNAGMVRKSYRYLQAWGRRRAKKLSKLQKQLILAAYRALKPGGVLVYSTCTLEPIENEEVVDHLLRCTDAEVEAVQLPLRSHPPFEEFEGRSYTSEVRKCLRIHPQDNDTEGFFVARLRKP